MAQDATTERAIRDALLEYWQPDEAGQIITYQERGYVFDIEIREPDYLDAGLYDTLVIGKAFPSWCDDIAHRVEKTFCGFGAPAWSEVLDDTDAWSICGYADDYWD